MKTHLIYWRSKITGAHGRGTKAMTKRGAKETVRQANIKYPELMHWAIHA